MESYKEKIANFKIFQARYEKEIKNISIEEFEQYFYAKNYFLVNKVPYDDERFFDSLFEIISNIVKARLQELEYYINLKPQTNSMQIESEVIAKEHKSLQKQCLKFQIYYKTMHKLGIENLNNTESAVKFLEQVYQDVVQFKKTTIKLQDKFIKGFEAQLKELESEKKVKYESSIFN